MSEADVVYSDVKFTKTNRKGTGRTSPPAPESQYSEVRLFKSSEELSGGITLRTSASHAEESQHRSESGTGSKVTLERVAIVVLTVLLAAAAIALGCIFYKNNQTIRQLGDEISTLKKNLTDKLSVKPYTTVLPTCPEPPAEPCRKCPSGWEKHQQQCYYFSSVNFTWANAKEECRTMSGRLVKIESKDEQNFLQQKLTEKMDEPEDKFWIGLTDSQTEGTWLWDDDTPLSTSLAFWSSNEPDDWKGRNNENEDGEDCVRMGEKTGCADLKCWFDKSCKVPHKIICEKQAESGKQLCV